MAFTSALKKPNPGDARLPSKPSKDLPSCSPSASKLLFELTPAELIEITADVLQRTIDANNALLGGRKQARSEITRFHTRDPPPISVKAYLARLLQLAPFPLDALLLAIVYINRLTHLQLARSPNSTRFQPLLPQQPSHASHTSSHIPKDTGPSPPLTPWTVHRLLLSALAIAAKYTSDAYIGQRRLSKVGGTSIKELSELEVEVFDQLLWSCYTSSQELESVCAQLWRTSKKCEQSEGPAANGSEVVDMPHIQSMSLSTPESNEHALSPTPAMSDGDSESSGIASSLDDNMTTHGSASPLSCAKWKRLPDKAPALIPIELH